MVHRRSSFIMLIFVLIIIFVLQTPIISAKDDNNNLSFSGTDYTVEVSYGENAGIPKDAYLKVCEVYEGSKEYTEYLTKTKEFADIDKYGKIEYARYLDISIMSDDRKIEPAEEVTVNIYCEKEIEKSENDNFEVIHFTDSGEREFLTIIDEKTDKDNLKEVIFEQESFSVIGMIIFEGVDTSIKQIQSENVSGVKGIDVIKEWSDGENNHEGDEITVTLSESEVNKDAWEKKEQLVLNSGNKWKGGFKNLDINKKYRVEETKVSSDDLEKTESYQSTITMSVMKKWAPVQENKLQDGKEIILAFNDGKDRVLRKSSVYEEKNLRMTTITIYKDSEYGKYLSDENSIIFIWEARWNKEVQAWELYHSRGEAYLTLEYDEENETYMWVTSREKTEGSYLSYEDGMISATVNGVTKYLGNITAQGPYKGLDEGNNKITKFEIYEYKVFRPAICNIFNKLNESVQEDDIQADIITEKTIDYLGDGEKNPDTDVQSKYPDNIVRDLYRLNLGIKTRTDKTGLDLLLVIDVSSSMKNIEDARDEDGNQIRRSEALRQALNKFVPSFLNNNSRNRISIVAFETDSIILQNWTNNPEEILEKINYEKDGELPLYNGDGTNYEGALSRAHEALVQCGYSTNAKAMIFLSDGKPTVYINGNDDIEPGNVTLNLGEASLTDTGIAGILPSGMKYLWKTEKEEAIGAADEAIASFKRHNPEIMTGAIAFNTVITDTLKTLSTTSEFVTEIENGTPKDLINAMELITEFVPKKVTITDELSEDVEIYTNDPDYKVTVKESDKEEIILFTSDNGITEDGKLILDNETPVNVNEKLVQLVFREDYNVEDMNTYNFSFNVMTSQNAFNKYADQKGKYTDIGDEKTDYGSNNTSSQKEGFFSNGDLTKTTYLLNGAEIEKNYRKPVIQVRDGKFSVKKTDVYGNVIDPGAEFVLYREADKDEEGEYTAVAEGKTDKNGILIFEHLRLSVFDNGYTYYLVEKSAPEGYVRQEIPIEIVLFENDIKIKGNNEYVSVNKNEMEVDISNVKKLDFSFIKTASDNHENELKGAVFELYELKCQKAYHEHKDDCWKYVSTQTSSPEVMFKDISAGKCYKLTEKKAPDKYVSPKGSWILVIDKYGDIQVEKDGDVPELFMDVNGKWILENEKILDIPVTGGKGKTGYFLIGILLIIGGMIMIRKRSFSKLMMMLMAVMICFQSLSVTAFAIESTDRGSITVNGVEENVSVKAYKLMDVNYDYEANQPKNPVYQWVSGVAGWVKEKHGDYIDTENNNAIEEEFSEAAEGNVALFYDELAVAIKEGNVTVDEITVKADGDTAIISNLEMGNYLLLIEEGTKVYRPLTANVTPEWKDNSWQMSHPVVEAKSSAPSITKTMKGEVKKDNIDIGDTLTFELVAVIPAYPDNAKAKKYVVSDRLSSGLSLIEDSVTVYGMNSGKEDVLMESGYVKMAKRPVNAEDNQISFALDFSYDEIKSFESLKITYNAVLNENAVAGETGNKNNAYLDYSNNPYIENDYSTDDDTVTVYTYGLKINKIDEDTNESLGGAEFTLSKDDEEIKFIGENGNYRVAKNGESGSSVVKVNENGMLVLRGLDADTYSLVEVKAPDGYVKLQHPVEVVIADENMDGIAEAGNQEFSDGYIPVTVKNDAGFTLPVTGGMGTTLFNIAGIVLMASGLTLIIVYLRKKNNYR